MKIEMKKSFLLLAAIVFLGLGCTPVEPVDPIAVSLEVAIDEPINNANIILDFPIEGGVITSPLTFNGTARVFENVVEWRVLDDQFVELASGITIAIPADIGQFGPFSESIFLPVITTNTLYLELFSTSAQDGSEQDLVSVELGILPVGQTTVKVFFADDSSTVEGSVPFIDFEKRTTQKTVNVAEFAIAELLKGPESVWASQYIPETAELDYIEIGGGGADVFFLDSEDAGWCSGIFEESTRYDQIAETMRQFNSVSEVDVYVNNELFDCIH